MTNSSSNGILLTGFSSSSRQVQGKSARFFNDVLSTRILRLMLSSLLFFAAVEVNAQEVSIGQGIQDGIILKHLKSDVDEEIFQVQLNNSTDERTIITVKDESGMILLNQFYSKRRLSDRNKKMAVNISIPRSDVHKLVFYVRPRSSRKPSVFRVNVDYASTNQVSVSQLL